MSITTPRKSPRHPKVESPSKDQVLDMREVFNVFDLNKSGFIEPFELKVALRAMGFEISKAQVREIIADLRKTTPEIVQRSEALIRQGNSDQPVVDVAVNFEEFAQIVETQLANRNDEDELRHAFHILDLNKRNRIGLNDLKGIMKVLGEEKSYTDKQLSRMIQMFDTDGDGNINFDEFCAIMDVQK